MAGQVKRYTNPAAGMAALGKVFKRLPDDLKSELRVAVGDTATEVANDAKRRAASHVLTGALVDHIDSKVFGPTGIGIVGIRKGAETVSGSGGSALTSKGAKLIRPSKYAHLLEFGSKRQRAYPFMIPAAENNRSRFAKAVNAAAKRAAERIEPVTIFLPIGGGNTGLL